MADGFKLLYDKCQQKGYQPQHVAEVGVYLPETSNIRAFIEEGLPATLVEADPVCVAKIRDAFADFPHVRLHPVAVNDAPGTIRLYKREASSFIEGLAQSPATVNDGYVIKEEDSIEIEALRFDSLDTGDIDLISIDIEGSEWFVIKHMKSRPAIISIETHGKYYINPFLDEILDWIARENYEVWYKTNSDTIFVKRGTFPITSGDKMSLSWRNFYLAWRRAKGHVKAFLGLKRKAQ